MLSTKKTFESKENIKNSDGPIILEVCVNQKMFLFILKIKKK